MSTTAQLLDSASALLLNSWDMEPEEAQAALDAFLAGSQDKLSALRAVAKAADAQIAAHKAEVAAHQARIKAADRTAERVTQLGYDLLCARRELGEEPKVPGVARIQANGGKVPLVFDPSFRAEHLPDAYTVVRIEPDKEAIREALERCEELPGVVLGARGESLRWA